MTQTKPPARIAPTTVDGQPAWIKRRERLGLRMRLQKGNADRAFQTELAALHRMQGKGLAVPRLLHVETGSFTITDGGRNLRKQIVYGHLTEPERDAALIAAATALGRLHAAGFSHGRPALKDICWQEGTITLIDFERATPRRNTPSGHALDVIVLFHSMIGVTGGPTPAVHAARAAYIDTAPPGIWPLAAKRLRRLAPLARLIRPAVGRLSHKAEFASIAPTVAFFTGG